MKAKKNLGSDGTRYSFLEEDKTETRLRWWAGVNKAKSRGPNTQVTKQVGGRLQTTYYFGRIESQTGLIGIVREKGDRCQSTGPMAI